MAIARGASVCAKAGLVYLLLFFLFYLVHFSLTRIFLWDRVVNIQTASANDFPIQACLGQLCCSNIIKRHHYKPPALCTGVEMSDVSVLSEKVHELRVVDVAALFQEA